MKVSNSVKINGIELPPPKRWESLIGSLTDGVMYGVRTNIINHMRESPTEKILLFVNSELGGDIGLCNGFYYWIRTFRIPLVTVADGELNSAGLYAYLAGRQRFILPGTRCYFHKGIIGERNTTVFEQYQADGHMFETIKGEAYKIVCRETRLTKDELQRLEDKKAYIDANQAVQYGIAHRVIRPTRSYRRALVVPGKVVKFRRRA